MAQFFYNLLLLVLAPVAIPYWVLRSHAKGHSWSSHREALGFTSAPKDTTRQSPVWFHAVSVGEVQSSLPLLRSLRRAMPALPIYLSTGTATGRKLAEEKLQGVTTAIFRAPLDFPWCVALVFSRLRPRLLVVFETELWPNYYFQAKRFGTSTMIVNGRISDRSAPKYRKLRFVFRSVLHCIDAILVQSDADRKRFIDAGAPPSRTAVGGNLKYDFDPSGSSVDLPPDLKHVFDGLAPDLVLVAGSTREGEEAILAPALSAVANRVSKSLLVVAPRHPSRFGESASTLRSLGLPVFRRSQLGTAESIDLPAVLLLDTLGELASLYCRADIVFVGGSLNGWGGHNVLEPVLYGKPVVVGPHMHNFRQITVELREAGGLVQVEGGSDLSNVLVELASDVDRRRSIGRAGLALAISKRGATRRAANEALRLYRIANPRQPPGLIKFATLRIPSSIWSAAARLRRHAYATGAAASHRLTTPVVSVGNLVAGGTGKTPTVAWLVERLWERGRIAGILTRGYRRRETTQLRLLEASADADPSEAGDEPAMLARRFASTAPRTKFAVHSNRFSAGRALEGNGGIDIVILDDGFQHMQLERALNIVLLDASAPFGNGYFLPLGRLRESPASLKHADLVLLTRCDPDVDYATVLDSVSNANPRAKVFHSRMVATGLLDLGTGQSHGLGSLSHKAVAAFCGIGNPESFFGEVRNLGCEVVHESTYSDHHQYTERDKASLRRASAENGAEAFLTTAKDAMNLGDATELGLPAYALQIDLQVEEAEELLDRVLSAVAR